MRFFDNPTITRPMSLATTNAVMIKPITNMETVTLISQSSKLSPLGGVSSSYFNLLAFHDELDSLRVTKNIPHSPYPFDMRSQ